MSLLPLFIVLLALGYILFVRISVDCRYRVEESVSREIQLRFFPFNISTATGKGKHPKKGRTSQQPGVRDQSGRSFHFGKFLQDDYQAFFHFLLLLLDGLRRIVAPKGHCLAVSLQGSLGTPDMTGIALGLLGAVRPVLGRAVTLSCQPDFRQSSIRGEIECRIVFRMYIVLFEAVYLLFRLPKETTIRILKKLCKGAYHGSKP